MRIPRPALRALGVVVLPAVLSAGETEAQSVFDHLKCYRVKDPLKLGGTADLDTLQFGADPGCKISQAKLFCVPATKANVAVTDKSTGTPITPLPVSGPDPGDRICYKVKCAAPVDDQQATDQFGTRIFRKVKAALVCTPARTLRFVANGDGTVTDRQTGLQWEQKTDDGSIHDKDNIYTWTAMVFGLPPNGTAFTDFLPSINFGVTGVGNCESTDGSTQTGGFANHCDWRIPTIAELRSIVDLSVPGCGAGNPCIDQAVFGPTAFDYWSSTTLAGGPISAWQVSFFNGTPTFAGLKIDTRSVRAVRGGS